MAYIEKSISSKENKVGLSEILLRLVIKRGVSMRAKSGIWIKPTQWDHNKNQIKAGSGTADIRECLQKLENSILKAVLTINENSVNKIWLESFIDKIHHPENYTQPKSATTLLAIVEDFIKKAPERKDNNGRTISVKTIYQYGQLQTMLHKFAKKQFSRKHKENKQDWELSEVNKDFYDAYVDFMYSEGYKLNTVGKHIKNLKVIINSLPDKLRQECKIINSRECKKLAEDIDNVYLTEAELKILEDYDFSDRPSLDRVRDWFLLLCWTGCRYSDLDKLTSEYIKNDLFQFRQQKTNNVVAIPLHPTVKKILAKYNGEIPYPITNQKFNDAIKEVMKLVEFTDTVKIKRTTGGILQEEEYPKHDLISSHTGRRSFASNAYLSGIPSITIMKITGHKTETAFLKYIKVSPEEHAKKMAEMWNTKYNI